MAFAPMTTTQQFLLTITPENAAGKPAPVDGLPVWASSDESVVHVVPTADGLSAEVVAQGVGEYSVSVSADADLGAGVRTITASDRGSVTLGEATQIAFVVGPVEEQPAATTATLHRKK